MRKAHAWRLDDDDDERCVVGAKQLILMRLLRLLKDFNVISLPVIYLCTLRWRMDAEDELLF